ncbi:MAG: hypothetical protein JSY10_25450 [Paenibacillus sp.]|nr:hypothetical protein [Paenibacillus sp.]
MSWSLQPIVFCIFCIHRIGQVKKKIQRKKGKILLTDQKIDVNATMAELTVEQKENEFVQHALNVRSSLATGNFHRFFILYRNAPNMGGYLIDQFCERERVRALIVLCKA